MPFFAMRSFIKRSNAMMRSARFKLYNNMYDSRRAIGEVSRSHPAAMASSGLRSMDQNIKLRVFRGTARLAMKEIRGGEVIAITTSNRGSDQKRKMQAAMNVPKSAARRHLARFPKPVERTRMILTPFQVSCFGKRTLGSSYPRELQIIVTSCPACARDRAKSLACWAVETTSGWKA